MLNFFPQYPTRKVNILDGIWDFALVEECPDPANPAIGQINYTDKLAVPGVFDAMPAYPANRGTAFYRTFIKTTPYAKLFLKSGGLGMWGAFFWDGKRVAIQDLPYSGMDFTFDAGEGETHELVVAIDNRLDYQRQPLLSQYYDYYCHGGIFRTIELHEIPELSIDRVQVKTVDLEEGIVQVKLFLNGKAPEAIVVTGKFDDGAEFTRGLDVEGQIATFEATLADKTPWTSTSPKLHTLELSIGDDTIIERFGLRIVEAKDGKILLNGKPLKLHGYCRHEAHPEFGPALPLQIVLEDLQLLKKTGCNFVRGSHYPQDQRFLSMCDEMGIMVWEETVGWGDREAHLVDDHFKQAQLRQTDWMVKNSYNHPAVIMWGFLNEGDSTLPAGRDLYQAMATKLRDLDGSRPVTYASMFFDKDINYDLADIVSINIYPGWYASNQETFRPLGEIKPRIERFIKFMKDNELANKPLIISEIGAGAIYGWRDRFHAHWSEEYQADYLEEVCTIFAENDDIVGLALWQFIDCRTYSTSRALSRPRAFNNKGLFDEYRRPKLAFDVVAKHYHQLPW